MGEIGNVKVMKNAKAGKKFRFSGKVEVFVLPDYNPIFGIISKSGERLYIQAPYMDFRWFNGTPLLDAILQAARNGADVKILFDSKYNAEENQKIADFLNEIGKEENLKIEAKLVKPNRFESLHAKMIIADDKCVITSANFNKYGLKLNREVGVIIYSKEASNFLAEQFLDDWNGFENEFGLNYAIPAIVLLTVSVIVTYRAMRK
jgi:phosphatidylserine/phosphatidylglycerophosphate/cardiolipin synthase-like enzyme